MIEKESGIGASVSSRKRGRWEIGLFSVILHEIMEDGVRLQEVNGLI